MNSLRWQVVWCISCWMYLLFTMIHSLPPHHLHHLIVGCTFIFTMIHSKSFITCCYTVKKVLPECIKCLGLRASNCPIGVILFILFNNIFTFSNISCGVIVGMNLFAILFAFRVLANERSTLAESLFPAP